MWIGKWLVIPLAKSDKPITFDAIIVKGVSLELSEVKKLPFCNFHWIVRKDIMWMENGW